MGEMSELDGFVIAAGYAGVLRFVCIADSQQGVKESVVTVTCSSVWCWGVWESWNSRSFEQWKPGRFPVFLQSFARPVLFICPAHFLAAATAGCPSPIKGNKGQSGDRQGGVQM